MRIVSHDDPFTPMDFVVEVLTTMDAAAAARGLAEVRSRAEAAEWPLRVSAEAVG